MRVSIPFTPYQGGIYFQEISSRILLDLIEVHALALLPGLETTYQYFSGCGYFQQAKRTREIVTNNGTITFSKTDKENMIF